MREIGGRATDYEPALLFFAQHVSEMYRPLENLMTIETELLLQKDAAKIVGLHPITLWKHRIDWKIPHTFLPNGQVRYPRTQLMRWIADRTATSAADVARLRDGRRKDFAREESLSGAMTVPGTLGLKSNDLASWKHTTRS